LSTVATTDDEALLRAVLANPADEAPRLVYADWLDERDDPRGEYLRADWEAAKEARSGSVSERALSRLAELRTETPPNWMIDVSVGPSAWVKQVVYDESKRPFDRIAAPAWSWSQVERSFEHLGRLLYASGWLVGPERWGAGSEEFLAVLGGDGDGGEVCFYIGGRLGGESRKPLRRHDGKDATQAVSTEPGYRLREFPRLMRAARWAYFVGTFWPGLAGYHTHD
jgi:uncharacterized protein (TIGR02996 family)